MIKSQPLEFAGTRSRFDLLEIVFIVSAFIAPFNLALFQALTVYDLVIFGLAFLVVFGPRRVRLLPPGLLIAAGVFLIAALVSSFRAIFPIEALTQVLQFGFIFLVQIPVVLSVARSWSVIRAALLAFALGSLAVLMGAFLTQEAGGANRIITHYTDNPNALAYPVAYLVPFVLHFMLDQWRKRRRVICIIGSSSVFYLFLWTLTASASRSATGATLVAVILFLTFRGGIQLFRVPLRFAIAALTLVLLGALVYQTEYFPSTLKERIAGTVDPGTGAVKDERLALDRAGLRAFAASPVVGLGLNNFRYVGQFYDDEATFHDPHNLWVQFLAQTGFFGAAAFFLIIVGWLRLIFRGQSSARVPAQRELLWAFIASMAAILVFHMATPIMIQRHYWLLFGLGVAATWNVRYGADERIQHRSLRRQGES